jgi:hypothetical protein
MAARANVRHSAYSLSVVSVLLMWPSPTCSLFTEDDWSSMANVDWGLLQGSILGPLLFILYIYSQPMQHHEATWFLTSICLQMTRCCMPLDLIPVWGYLVHHLPTNSSVGLTRHLYRRLHQALPLNVMCICASSMRWAIIYLAPLSKVMLHVIDDLFCFCEWQYVEFLGRIVCCCVTEKLVLKFLFSVLGVVCQVAGQNVTYEYLWIHICHVSPTLWLQWKGKAKSLGS